MPEVGEWLATGTSRADLDSGIGSLPGFVLHLVGGSTFTRHSRAEKAREPSGRFRWRPRVGPLDAEVPQMIGVLGRRAIEGA
jgi:hypothetical protein